MESPYILKFENGKLSCELSEETKQMIEDEKREERRIENQEHQEELTDRQQSHKDAGVCEGDFC
jgi:hypothetical protein